MSHTTQDKNRLLARIRRIRGQVNAIERSLEGELDCATVLQTASACRGALNSLISELVNEHIRHHLVDARTSTALQKKSAQQLSAIIKTYFR